ncbi:MAG: hypothetical protein ACRC0R_03900 [Cetobacterium sp.]
MKKKSLFNKGKKISLTFPGTEISVVFSRRGENIKAVYDRTKITIPRVFIKVLFKAWNNGVSYDKEFNKLMKLKG